MIVAPQDGALRLITQNDHAAFSGELVRLWHKDGLPRHPRRRELVFAAREHDNGWCETDSAPFCDRGNGRPHDFLSLPLAERQRLWRRGPRRHVAKEPYAALLITRHAQNLHRENRGKDDWAEIFTEWDELEASLKEELGVDDETVAADYRWVDLSDTLSLAACAGWQRPFEHLGVRIELRGDTLSVDPFPLAGATTFRVACRTIPDRRYESDTDLATELASARWEEYAVRVVGV